ncbi:amino acid ABC transporter permease [Ornithinimicrobium cavernae]|uniref:amino acid ABC transporter permease n=1 Tax=Ornithinimicrobium cavernae TaxID=2666047 RepID=UPI000D687E99|nr:amino acid ABC transporter permease [Ornithinimicrobium cavernae]
MSDTTRVLFDAPGPKARLRYLIMTVIGVLLVLAFLYVIYGRLEEKGQLSAARWDWVLTSSAWTNYLIPGIWDTVRAAAISIVLSMILALILAMARMSDLGPLRWVASVIVEFFRAVPVLIMMLFVFYFLAHRGWFPDTLNPMIGVIFGLTMYNSSVLCEVIRNGVASLPAGQREAGLSIGLSPAQVRRSILIPQSLTAMLPTLVSQVIVITKDTALGYLILYPELVTRGRQVGSAESATLPAYIVAALLFIIINYTLSKVAEALENRQRRRKRTAGPVAHADETVDPGAVAVGRGAA